MTSLTDLDGPALWERFVALCADPEGTQRDFLLDLLAGNAATRFGRAHGFGGIRSVEDFRRQVPLSEWSDYAPLVEEIANGADGVTLAETPVRFVITSGTTGAPKRLPETRASQAAEAVTMKLRFLTLGKDHPRVMQGRTLALAQGGTLGTTPRGIPYGYASGGTLAGTAAEVLQKRLAFPLEVMRLGSSEGADYCLVRFALEHSVAMLIGNNPLRFAGLFELAERRHEDLLRDIRDGTISVDLDTSALLPHARPNPERARELQTRRRPAQYWPELEVLTCWTSGPMAPLVPQALRWCGPDTRVREYGYGASEGKFTIPLRDGQPAGVLATFGIFFEFLPTDGSAPLLAHEVQQGGIYELVLTNSMGLYRYRIHDLVQVVDTFHGTPVLAFVQKAGDVGNMVGEKILASNVLRALDLLGLRARHCHMVPLGDHYLLAVEPDGPVPPDAARRFDDLLSAESLSYGNRRREGLLRAPELAVMEPGWREALVRDAVAQRGGGREQLKLPVFRPDLPHPEMRQAPSSDPSK